MDSTKRSWAKAVSWRITASSATFLIAIFVGVDLSVAGSIAMLQMLINFILYFAHERIWNKISWGQQHTNQG